MTKIITLTTDFGCKDPYVGALKGALLCVNQNAVIVDISNSVKPGNIGEAALTVAAACAYYPAGTIHIGVVDPGVGSERRAIIVETEKYFFVGPDNGLFSLALGSEKIVKIVHITEKRYFNSVVSPTFHGRDIFAPVAAHLSLGLPPEAFGSVVNSLVTLPVKKPPLFEASKLYGAVIHIDTFGNIITSIKASDIKRYFSGAETAGLKVKIENKVSITGLCATYSDRGNGATVLLAGSFGYIEVALNGANAALSFNVAVGDKVILSYKEQND